MHLNDKSAAWMQTLVGRTFTMQSNLHDGALPSEDELNFAECIAQHLHKALSFCAASRRVDIAQLQCAAP